MNLRGKYRALITREQVMFKKLKRSLMIRYNDYWKWKYPNDSFKDFYNFILKNHHLDYIRHSYRSFKNGPGMKIKYSKRLIMKTLSKKMIEEGRKRYNKIKENYTLPY